MQKNCIDKIKVCKNIKERNGKMLRNYLDTIKNEQNVCNFNKEKLVDLRNIKINYKKNCEEKLYEFIEQVKNPYVFKVGDIGVKISFNSGDTIQDALCRAFSDGINLQTIAG